MNTINLLNVVELCDLPESLRINQEIFPCGGSVLFDKEDSLMQVFDAESDADFYALCNSLEAVDFKSDFQNRIAKNLFVEYSRNGQRIYLYYLDELKKIRATLIRNGCSTKDFCYSAPAVAESEFVFFRQQYIDEDTYLIRCCDNSWIFIDGGMADYPGFDDSLAEDVYSFMRKRSGLSDGEKLIISCWFMTHAHRDHLQAFSAMLKNHHDQIELQRVLANPNDPERIVKRNSSQPSYEICRERIAKWYPHVLFLKAQTGMELQIANVHFRILYTQQDHVEEWYVGDPAHHNLNFNNSSTVAMIEVDGMKILELADLFFTQDYVAPIYPMSVLECDILKVAHHYIDVYSDGFYQALTEHKMPQYALINATPSREFAHSLLLKQIMGERAILGSTDKIREFKMKSGKLEMTACSVEQFR